eukprot:421103-Amphidinium_carterae.4
MLSISNEVSPWTPCGSSVSSELAKPLSERSQAQKQLCMSCVCDLLKRLASAIWLRTTCWLATRDFDLFPVFTVRSFAELDHDIIKTKCSVFLS